MPDEIPPSADSARAGYEVKEMSVPLVAASAAALVLFGAALLFFLWHMSRWVLPPRDGDMPPIVMPGQRPVNDRLRALPPPRLDSLEPLEAQPPYRSSRPLPGASSPDQCPEDLRADRQPALMEYRWIDNGKIARIPIGRAMDAVVESARAKTVAKKGGGK